MTFDEYVPYIGTPENLQRAGNRGPRRDFSARYREDFEQSRLTEDQEAALRWLVAQPKDVSLCFTDPGFDVDLTVDVGLDVLYQVWEGRLEYGQAVRDRLLVVTGERELVRALPRALRFSPVAPYVRRAAAAIG